MDKIILGPCALESLTSSIKILEDVLPIVKNKDFYFKASYDKANRTSHNSKRGLGYIDSMLIFKDLKKTYPNLKITTDIHTEEIMRLVKDMGVIDMVQIPAFLCRQTDLIRACVDTGKIINIKKGQFLAPWDVGGILTKTEGAKRVWITERGTSFGYNTLVVDFTGMAYIMDNYGTDLIFDVTHSVQKPGGLGGSSGGNRLYVPRLAKAGAAAGIRSFFIEVHKDPNVAPSDGPNMLKLDDFEKLASDLKKHGSI